MSSCQFLSHIVFSSPPAPVITFPGTQTLHCLDCFGASQRVKTCWENAGYSACAFDLKLNEQHDLSLFGGCVELIRLLFMLLGSIFTGSHVTQWITKEYNAAPWNTMEYMLLLFFKSIYHSDSYSIYSIYIFCLIRKVRVFDFMLRTFCVCVRVLLLFLFVLRLLIGGIVVAGPPCSLHIAASQSVHQRSLDNLMGNTRNMRVRLSKLIWINFVRWLHWKNDLLHLDAFSIM